MPDVFTKAKRSQVMSRIRGRGNKETELALAKLLRAAHITGWRRQVRLKVGELRVEGRGTSPRPSSQRGEGVRVRPDFTFRKERVVIFVDGCFWHGCPKHSNMPANNRTFWLKKLTANKARDRQVTRTLRQRGWRVLRVWQHELARKNEARLMRRLEYSLGFA